MKFIKIIYNTINNKRGFVAIAAVVIMALLLALGGAAMTMSRLGYQVVSADKKFQAATWAAEFGINHAISASAGGSCPATSTTTTGSAGIASYSYFSVQGSDYCFIKSTGTFAGASVVRTAVVPIKMGSWGGFVTKGGSISLGGSGSIAGCDDDEQNCTDVCPALPAVITESPTSLSYSGGTTPTTSCGSEGSLRGLVGSPPRQNNAPLFATELTRNYLNTDLSTLPTAYQTTPPAELILAPTVNADTTDWEKFMISLEHALDIPDIYPSICGLFHGTLSYCHSGVTPNSGAIDKYIQKIINNTAGTPWAGLSQSTGACNVSYTPSPASSNVTVTINNANITFSGGSSPPAAIDLGTCGSVSNPIRIAVNNTGALNVTVNYTTEFTQPKHILIDYVSSAPNLTITNTPNVAACNNPTNTSWKSNLYLAFNRDINITANHLGAGVTKQRAPHIIIDNRGTNTLAYNTNTNRIQQINGNLERVHLITSGDIKFSESVNNIDIRLSKFVSGGEIRLGLNGTNNRFDGFLTDTHIFAKDIRFNLTSTSEVRGGVFYAYNNFYLDTQGSLNFGTGPDNSTNMCPSGAAPSYTGNNGKPVLIIAGDPRNPNLGSSEIRMPGNLTINGLIYTMAPTMSITGSVSVQGTIINPNPTANITNTGNSVIQFNRTILKRLADNLSACFPSNARGLMKQPECSGNKRISISNTKASVY